ncbi:MAG: metallophosphoesterase family protein, partial [bacterium]|nr:metallophosphoesterase family protein [bacterium]
MKRTKKKTEAERIIRKLKKYIYFQCIFAGLLAADVIRIIFQYSFNEFITNLIPDLILVGLFLLISEKKRKYLAQCNYEDIRLDTSVHQMFYQLNDRYSKKLLNTSMVFFGVIGYVIFFIIFSILCSQYTLLDVSQQVIFMSFMLQILVYLFVRNYLFKRVTDVLLIGDQSKHYKNQWIKVSLLGGIYYTLIMALFLVFWNKGNADHSWFYIVTIIGVSLLVITIVTYNLMSLNLFLTEPYISMVSKVLEKEDQIEYNEENGVYKIITEKKEFKILQFTDIHLGGSILSVSKDVKALQACYALIAHAKPDLVVVTGDLVFPMGVMSFSLNNKAPIIQFSNFMKKIGVPWAFTYGNHDTESMATLNVAEFDTLMKSLSIKNAGNLLYPHIQPDIYGRNNQRIEIRNVDGSLKQALFLLDSNSYLKVSGKLNEYDYIHDDQVEWYKKNVLELSDQEGQTISSMLFFHIPLREYRGANDLYEAQDDQVKYFYGKIGETMINKICCSNYESKLFDTAVELGSTKAMFCGHDHYNNQSLEYKGIRLSYGYSIDYLAMP